LETGSLTVELTPLLTLSSCGDVLFVAEGLRAAKRSAFFRSLRTQGSLRACLLHFLMRRVFPATLAKLLQLDPIRSRLPVLGRRVVALFAITALHRNNFSGHKTKLLSR
jgi:hypothetical protein